MANNKAPTNAFSATNQPSLNGNTRGKANLNKYLAALKAANGWSEHDLLTHVATEAFVNKDKEFRDLFFKYCYSAPKSTLQPVSFQYDRNLPYHEKCEVIMDGIATGAIPPDVGIDLINGVKHISAVAEQADLTKRIEQLEKLLLSLTVFPAEPGPNHPDHILATFKQ